MFYGTSDHTKMECETYQDCGWFQEKPITRDFTSKLSPAESNAEPETDDIGFRMQFAANNPWGEEHLEVFDDDINVLNNKLGEETISDISPSNENYSALNFKMEGEDSVNNIYNINDCIIRKTDCFDNMKNISSIDPADVVPISFQERINNPSYFNLFDGMKCEVKEEPGEYFSPGSNTYIFDSDDSDLGIGREEVIEVEDFNGNKDVANHTVLPNAWSNIQPINSVPSKVGDTETPIIFEDNMKNIQGVSNAFDESVTNIFSNNNNNTNNSNKNNINDNCSLNLKPQKTLSLDLCTPSIDQTLTACTPDLDFMDLVDFINNSSEQIQTPVVLNNFAPHDTNTSGTSKSTIIAAATEERDVVKEKSTNPKKQTYLAIPRQITSNSPDDHKLPKMVILNNTSTIKLDDIADSQVSIAERIKTGSGRRKNAKYKFDGLDELMDDDEDYHNDDDDDDDDFDAEEYAEESTSRKRIIPPRKRSRSSISSESSVGSKRSREEGKSNRYRELRDKNNEASRRSRQNRKDKEKDLFRTLQDTEQKNIQLKARSEELEKLVTSLRTLLLQVVLKKGQTS